MRSERPVVLLGLASLGTAKPLFPEMGQIKKLVARENGTWEDICNKWKLDDDDPSIAKDLWDNTGTGAWFDEWLSDHDDHGLWTATMDEEVNNLDFLALQSHRHATLLRTAVHTPGTLEIYKLTSRAEFHFDQGMGSAYWILFAASRLHDGLEYMFEQLQSSTLINSLELDSIVEKYGGDEPDGDLNILAIISSSLVVAAGALPNLAAPLTVLVGIFGLASQFQTDPPDPTKALREQLGQGFESAQKSLEDTTAVVFGGDTETPVDDLPYQTGTFNNALARFFADGKFLVEDIQSSLQGVLDDYIRIQQLMISGMLIDFYGYVVVVDTTVEDAGSCDDMNSSWWEESMGRCFQIMKNRAGEMGNMPLGLDDGPFTVAMNDYQIDVGEFFSIAWACAEAHPDGDGQVSDQFSELPTDGKKPECFYNVGVVEGEVTWTENANAYITNIGLNTAGVNDLGPPPNYPDDRPERV